jgi:hypothetical protein
MNHTAIGNIWRPAEKMFHIINSILTDRCIEIILIIRGGTKAILPSIYALQIGKGLLDPFPPYYNTVVLFFSFLNIITKEKHPQLFDAGEFFYKNRNDFLVFYKQLFILLK